MMKKLELNITTDTPIQRLEGSSFLANEATDQSRSLYSFGYKYYPSSYYYAGGNGDIGPKARTIIGYTVAGIAGAIFLGMLIKCLCKCRNRMQGAALRQANAPQGVELAGTQENNNQIPSGASVAQQDMEAVMERGEVIPAQESHQAQAVNVAVVNDNNLNFANYSGIFGSRVLHRGASTVVENTAVANQGNQAMDETRDETVIRNANIRSLGI